MPSSRARDPVILIGAPRSGTSLLTRMLEGLGLFVGRGLNAMHEARFFQILNHWVIFQSGGSWDHPQPVRRLLEHAEVRGLTTNYLRFLLQTPRIASYLGWWNYLRFRSLFNVTVDWGWKDAHTTLTLPVWMDLFPQARVVHIVRHGVDVAASLRTYGRAAPGERWAKKLYYRLKPLHWIRPKRGLFVYSLRCDSLEGGFGLWEEYVAEARRHLRGLGPQGVEVQYEKLLADPQPVLASLARFCQLPANQREIARVTGQARPERAYAHRQNPELRAFAEGVADRLKAYGY